MEYENGFHRQAGTFLEPKGGLDALISSTDDVRLGIMMFTFK